MFTGLPTYHNTHKSFFVQCTASVHCVALKHMANEVCWRGVLGAIENDWHWKSDHALPCILVQAAPSTSVCKNVFMSYCIFPLSVIYPICINACVYESLSTCFIKGLNVLLCASAVF